MGQLRAALRALTRTTSEPAELLAALNEGLFSTDSSMVTMALAVVGRDGHVAYGYAGHPPLYARSPDGRVVELAGGRSVPLGVVEQPTFVSAETQLARGSHLVLYTDGLVERRGISIDVGLARVVDSLGPPADSLLALADRLVGLADDLEQSDDVAVLVARIVTEEERLEVHSVRHLSEVRVMRATVGTWLAERGVEDDDIFAVTVAVGEAVVNALQHAYPDTEGTVDVAVELDRDVVRATVSDHGFWPEQDAVTDDQRGLRLMRGLAEVEVVRGRGGTTISIGRQVVTRV
jgi:anti-sigma regulatory factor (Ser/Thr protein kinase)